MKQNLQDTTNAGGTIANSGKKKRIWFSDIYLLATFPSNVRKLFRKVTAIIGKFADSTIIGNALRKLATAL